MVNLSKHKNLDLKQHVNLRTVHVCTYHCAQLSYTIRHGTVLIIFFPNLQTIVISLMLSIGRKGRATRTQFTHCMWGKQLKNWPPLV